MCGYTEVECGEDDGQEDKRPEQWRGDLHLRSEGTDSGAREELPVPWCSGAAAEDRWADLRCEETGEISVDELIDRDTV